MVQVVEPLCEALSSIPSTPPNIWLLFLYVLKIIIELIILIVLYKSSSLQWIRKILKWHLTIDSLRSTN
jgi:cell shape-determining protein MreC